MVGLQSQNAGDRAVVNVAGSFSTGSGLTGIKELKVMGDVNISGGGITGLENIYSNGNVTLNASGSVNLVSAKELLQHNWWCYSLNNLCRW